MSERGRRPADTGWHVNLSDTAATRAVWQDVTEMAVDLVAALRAAQNAGTLAPAGVVVLYWHYVEGETLDTIADRLHLSYDQVRTLHRESLHAIRETGLLEGYET